MTGHPGPVDLGGGVRSVLAPNPSAMTLHGTNTYLLGRREITVIDPGPDLPAHLSAIEAALPPQSRLAQVVVTHAHADHAGLAHRLARRHGAPVVAFGDATTGRSAVMERLAMAGSLGGGEGVVAGFAPDIAMPDGALLDIEGMDLRVLWTPGHMGNHICLILGETVFSGDHVMGWASTLVSPPDGDMGAYMASLERLAGVRPARLLPGHGPAVTEPAARIAELVAHRRAREAQILGALRDGPADTVALAARIYADTPAGLMGAARRNILAHLVDLATRGVVRMPDPLHGGACFALPAGAPHPRV